MRRRRGWIVWGALLAVLGLVFTIVAAVVLMVSRGVSSLDPIVEGRTPEQVVFDADEQEYEILLVRRRGDNSTIAEHVVCEVGLANGATLSIDGDEGLGTARIANTESVGTFDAVEGSTTVACSAGDETIHFVVDEPSRVVKGAMLVLWIAIGVLLLGIGLFVGGILWKRPATT